MRFLDTATHRYKWIQENGLFEVDKIEHYIYCHMSDAGVVCSCYSLQNQKAFWQHDMWTLYCYYCCLKCNILHFISLYFYTFVIHSKAVVLPLVIPSQFQQLQTLWKHHLAAREVFQVLFTSDMKFPQHAGAAYTTVNLNLDTVRVQACQCMTALNLWKHQMFKRCHPFIKIAYPPS